MTETLAVLIAGGGAREDAISRAYERSPRVDRIIIAPGNDFIGYKREKEVIIDKAGDLKKPQSYLDLARKYHVDLVDVAQDDALAAGTVDLLRANGFAAFGPTKAAARLEWDKKWSRQFMKRNNIPHPQFRYFDSEEPAVAYLAELYTYYPKKLVYVKATGLCAGKGALDSSNLDKALENARKMKGFGEAGREFLVEDGMIGEEFSSYAISDGKDYFIFKSAQDNKRVYNFDAGDQTGGMGAISPSMAADAHRADIDELLVSRAINGMAAEGVPFEGILYVGGMAIDRSVMNVEWPVMNVEYNARWGDPEGQEVLPGIKTDYASIILACLAKKLKSVDIQQDNKTRVCVVGASRGYPNDYSTVKGKRIFGLEKAMEMEGVTVLGAGIEVRDGKFLAKGGRLFNVIGEGNNILEAKQRAYAAIAHVGIEGNNLHYRTDVGWRDVERFLKALQVS